VMARRQPGQTRGGEMSRGSSIIRLPTHFLCTDAVVVGVVVDVATRWLASMLLVGEVVEAVEERPA
jgi:hypothetical protein